jgi:hypothetical protein
MSLGKNRQKCSLIHFWQNGCKTFALEKSSKKIQVTSDTLKELPKVSNSPLGENSPNLVTLLVSTKEWVL